MSLAIYRWEWNEFKWAWKVNIKGEYRSRVARRLGYHFVGYEPMIQLRGRNRGRAWENGIIKLPSYNSRCTLGLIIHEVSHLLSFKLGSKGHDAIFKKALIKVHVETRGFKLLSKMFTEIRKEMAEERRRMNKQFTSAAKAAARIVKAKQVKSSREYKITKLRERIKRLESRAKRIQTLTSSAKRSLAAYERAEALSLKQVNTLPQVVI